MGIREAKLVQILFGAFLLVAVSDVRAQLTRIQSTDKNSLRFCLRSNEEQTKQVCFVDQFANQSKVEPTAFAESQHRLQIELERRAAEARTKQPNH